MSVKPVTLAARGSSLSTSPDDIVAYTPVAQLMKLVLPDCDTNMEDITCLDSPGVDKYVKPILQDNKSVQLHGVQSTTETTQNSLGALHHAQTEVYVKVILPDTSFYKFQGYVSKYKPSDLEVTKALTSFQAEITINGPVTYTPAGGALQNI